MTDESRLTKEELHIVLCDHCAAETYDPRDIPERKRFMLLPEPLTSGNKRHFMYVKGKMLIVCENCRYNVFGAY